MTDAVPVVMASVVENPPAYAPGMEPTPPSQSTVAQSQTQQPSPQVAASSSTTRPGANKPSITTTTTTTYIPAAAGAAATATTGGVAASTTNTASAAPPPAGKVSLPGLSQKASSIVCPYCNQQGVTRTRSQIDCCTVVGVIVMILVFWPLFWLPFVCPCCMTTEHYCPRCHRKVGRFVSEFMGPKKERSCDNDISLYHLLFPNRLELLLHAIAKSTPSRFWPYVVVILESSWRRHRRDAVNVILLIGW